MHHTLHKILYCNIHIITHSLPDLSEDVLVSGGVADETKEKVESQTYSSRIPAQNIELEKHTYIHIMHNTDTRLQESARAYVGLSLVISI